MTLQCSFPLSLLIHYHTSLSSHLHHLWFVLFIYLHCRATPLSTPLSLSHSYSLIALTYATRPGFQGSSPYSVGRASPTPSSYWSSSHSVSLSQSSVPPISYRAVDSSLLCHDLTHHSSSSPLFLILAQTFTHLRFFAVSAWVQTVMRVEGEGRDNYLQ
jgi:hypothetical protein